MKNVPHNKNDAEEVVIDDAAEQELTLEEDEEAGVSLRDTLKTLRAELAVVRKERDEHLAGWQRAKADLINYRRVVSEDQERDKARAKGAMVRSIIPALDSFENALTSNAWNTVNAEWRDGVERIYAQFMKALAAEGLEVFGEAGEPFDPVYHECMSITVADDPAQDHTVARVLQKGYRIGTEVLRPAKVVVAQVAEHA